jgi:hypothetical protein
MKLKTTAIVIVLAGLLLPAAASAQVDNTTENTGVDDLDDLSDRLDRGQVRVSADLSLVDAKLDDEVATVSLEVRNPVSLTVIGTPDGPGSPPVQTAVLQPGRRTLEVSTASRAGKSAILLVTPDTRYNVPLDSGGFTLITGPWTASDVQTAAATAILGTGTGTILFIARYLRRREREPEVLK